jgi:alpha-D-ribose 1-methylphosphonate 5-triphosphate synthase subunit PhnH
LGCGGSARVNGRSGQLRSTTDGSGVVSASPLATIEQAMSKPGKIVMVSFALPVDISISAAAFAVYAGLAERESRIWLSTDLRRDTRLVASLRLYYGANCCVGRPRASVALMNGSEWDGLHRFTSDGRQPDDRCARIILEVDELDEGDDQLIFVDRSTDSPGVSVRGLSRQFWSDVNLNHYLRPEGVDFLLTCGNRVVAITQNCRVTTKA